MPRSAVARDRVQADEHAIRRAISAGLFAAVVLGLSAALLSGDDKLRRKNIPSSVPDPPLVKVDRRLADILVRGDPAGAFAAEDYPAEALGRGEQGRTVALLTVDASGAPTGCAIETSSGSAALDAATCRIACGRVRYRPARDSEGRPIASSTTLPVRWVLPDADKRPERRIGAALLLVVTLLAALSVRPLLLSGGRRSGRMVVL